MLKTHLYIFRKKLLMGNLQKLNIKYYKMYMVIHTHILYIYTKYKLETCELINEVNKLETRIKNLWTMS